MEQAELSCAGLERLPHLAVHDALAVIAARVARDHAPPETDGAGVAQVFGDFPASGEAAEDEPHRGGADAEAALGAGDEEFRHAVVDGGAWRRARGSAALGGSARHAAAHDQREAHGLGRACRMTRGKRVGVAEPVEELVGLAVTDFAQGGETAGAGARRQVVQIIAIDALDPEAVAFRVARVAHTNRHVGVPETLKKHGPDGSRARSDRAVWSQCREAADNSLPEQRRLTAAAGCRCWPAACCRWPAAEWPREQHCCRTERRAGGVPAAGWRGRHGAGGRRVRRSRGGRSGRSAALRRSRRSGAGLSAGGIILRTRRQQQCRSKRAKSNFGIHRSVPRYFVERANTKRAF